MIGFLNVWLPKIIVLVALLFGAIKLYDWWYERKQRKDRRY